MLPVIVASAQDEPFLGPDDLGADVEAAGHEALGHGAGMERAVPDIGHVARKERPGLPPVRAIIVQNLARTLGLGGAGLVPPGRIVADAIRRIADAEMRSNPIEKAGHGSLVRSIPADQPVGSEAPEIARAGDGIGRRLGRLFLPRVGRTMIEERVQFGSVEAEVPKVDAEVIEIGEFQGEQVLVPSGLLGEAVVGEYVGAFLRRGQVGELDDRHLDHPQRPGG